MRLLILGNMLMATTLLCTGCGPDLNGPLRPGEMAEANVNGVPLAIPMAFVPPHERFLYRRGTQEDGIRVEMNYPAMTPFVDPLDNSPTYLRYQYKLALNVSTDDHASTADRVALMRRMVLSAPRDENHGGTFVPGPWELQRYQWPPHVPALTVENFQGFDDDDQFVYPSLEAIETHIRCKPTIFPDAHSAEAQRRRERGEFTYVPSCGHYFRSTALNDAVVKLSYQRGHLEHWREIQAAAEAFLARHVVRREAASELGGSRNR